MDAKAALRAVTIIFAVLVCAAAVVVIVLTLPTIKSDALAAGPDLPSVIIDPGHGGVDGGAVGVDGAVEKNINLSIALKLRSFFLASGYQVIMTREDDRSIHDQGSDTIRKQKSSDLHNRLDIIKAHPKALFISIHQNIFQDSRYSGAQVFYSPGVASSKTLAETIQGSIRSLLQPDNSRVVKKATDDLFLLYYAKSPAIMVECGFLSNGTECRLLQDDAYQNKMAFAIYTGTLSYYVQTDKSGENHEQ